MGRSGGYLGGSTVLRFGSYSSGQPKRPAAGSARSSEININALRQRPDELSGLERAFVEAVARAQTAGRSAVIPRALKSDIANFDTVLRWVHSDKIRKRLYYRSLRELEARRLKSAAAKVPTHHRMMLKTAP